MSSLPESMNAVMRFGAVYGVLAVLFILNTVNLSLPFSGRVEVSVLLMAIYYWAIYRPTLLPPWVVFVAGVMFDVLSGLPIGLSAFIFLAVRWVVVDQRLFLMGQSFMMVWLVFAVVLCFASVLQWAVYGLLQLAWTPWQPVGVMVVLSVLVFPVVSFILHLSHRMLPAQDGPFAIMIK